MKALGVPCTHVVLLSQDCVALASQLPKVRVQAIPAPGVIAVGVSLWWFPTEAVPEQKLPFPFLALHLPRRQDGTQWDLCSRGHRNMSRHAWRLSTTRLLRSLHGCFLLELGRGTRPRHVPQVAPAFAVIFTWLLLFSLCP